jgi:hypothetical protein
VAIDLRQDASGTLVCGTLHRVNSHALIDAFWRWWLGVRDGIALHFARDGLSRTLTAAMDKHVRAIDDGLGWDLGVGTDGVHYLCLSSGGDPSLRVLTERWRRAAPPTDATWKFFAALPAAPSDDLMLEIDGVEIDLSQMVCGIEEDQGRERFDL